MKARGRAREEAERVRDGEAHLVKHAHPLRQHHTAAALEEQQVRDGEQEAARPRREERHARLLGLRGQRVVLVRRAAVLQAALGGRQSGRRRQDRPPVLCRHAAAARQRVRAPRSPRLQRGNRAQLLTLSLYLHKMTRLLLVLAFRSNISLLAQTIYISINKCNGN